MIGIPLLWVAFGLGSGIAAIPLVLMHGWLGPSHPPWELTAYGLPAWCLLLLSASAWLALFRPAGALAWAVALELGFVLAFAADLVYGMATGMPHRVRPMTVVVMLLLSVPAVGVGTFAGVLIARRRGRT